MSKKNPEQQPDLGYIHSEGKRRDDGLHDEMLSSKAGNAASQKAARDAAIKSGMSKATAEKFSRARLTAASYFETIVTHRALTTRVIVRAEGRKMARCN